MTDTENNPLPAPKLPVENGHLENEEPRNVDDRAQQRLLYPLRNINPSLVMRLRDLEFQSPKECVSMGRGYLNMGRAKDRYITGGRSFTCKSKDWEDDFVSDCYKCTVCGSTTIGNIRDASRTYCSDDCLVELRAREINPTGTSIFDLFSPGKIGTAEIRNEVLDGRAPCSVFLPSRPSVFERLNTLSETPQELLSTKKGDFVLVQDEGKGFSRGVVLDVNTFTYKVGLIDKGEIVDTSAVYATTEYLKRVISFGGVITFIGNESPLSKFIKFRARERRAFGIWLCDVLESDEDDVTEVILEEWVPPLKIKSVPLDPGCTVVISQYLDARTMYVRRVDNPWNEEYLRFNNDIAAYCVEAKKYKRIPYEGEICCVRYEKDGSYYRGVVQGIEEDLVAISFMDFGTEQLTEVSDLRYLPALAKQVPPFCSLVKLKDVTLHSTPAAIHYLNRLTAYNCELVLSFEGNEVILFDKYNGEIVNQVICDYEIPSWIGNRNYALSKTGEIYDYTNIQEVQLECGQLDDVYVLNFDENSFRNQGIFWGTINREDYLGHLNGELKDNMKEFCGHQLRDRYLPRIGELCIARFKGEWSRALCLEDKDVICKLMFIDHGASIWVETKHIRKMLKEFLEMPALALKCAVSDFKEMKESEKEDLVAYMKRMIRKAIRGVKVLRRSEEIYFLSITIPPDFDLNAPIPEVKTLNGDNLAKQSVAVSVACPAKGITCSDAILAIKSRIDFHMLNIKEPIYRNLHARILILQMEDEACRESARLLIQELDRIFADKGVQINFMTSGKVKLSGFAEFITKEEIVAVITKICGVDEDEVQATTVVQSGRTSVAWVKCPLDLAIDLAERGTLLVRSSSVKVEIQHRRPLRCFRCLREGHIGAYCTSETAESKCFRCSQTGHRAANCSRRSFCDLCSEKGFTASHRIGSSSCKSRGENSTG